MMMGPLESIDVFSLEPPKVLLSQDVDFLKSLGKQRDKERSTENGSLVWAANRKHFTKLLLEWQLNQLIVIKF